MLDKLDKVAPTTETSIYIYYYIHTAQCTVLLYLCFQNYRKHALYAMDVVSVKSFLNPTS